MIVAQFNMEISGSVLSGCRTCSSHTLTCIRAILPDSVLYSALNARPSSESHQSGAFCCSYFTPLNRPRPFFLRGSQVLVSVLAVS